MTRPGRSQPKFDRAFLIIIYLLAFAMQWAGCKAQEGAETIDADHKTTNQER